MEGHCDPGVLEKTPEHQPSKCSTVPARVRNEALAVSRLFHGADSLIFLLSSVSHQAFRNRRRLKLGFAYRIFFFNVISHVLILLNS